MLRNLSFLQYVWVTGGFFTIKYVSYVYTQYFGIKIYRDFW